MNRPKQVTLDAKAAGGFERYRKATRRRASLGLLAFRKWALLCLFFALSIKGDTSPATIQPWLIAKLPPVFDLLRLAALPVAVVAMGSFAALTLASRRRFAISIGPLVFVVTLTMYFLRSMQVGSGNPENFAAIVVLLCWASAVFAGGKGGLADVEVTHCIRIFCIGFTSVSFCLFLLGYGYPLTGGTQRFFGFTTHPNTQGAYSALAFGALLVLAHAPQDDALRTSSKRRLTYVFAAFSFVLVALSGSRTAMLAALAGALLILPWRVLTVSFMSMVALVTIGGTLLIVFHNSPIGDAAQRMISAPLDDRNRVLAALLSDFYSYPFIGAGDRSGVSASSYLTALSGTGIVVGTVFILTITSTVVVALKGLLAYRFKHVANNNLVYCMLFVQIAILSLTEAYLFDKFGLTALMAVLAMHKVERNLAFR